MSKCVESDAHGLSACVWLEFYDHNATFCHKYLKWRSAPVILADWDKRLSPGMVMFEWKRQLVHSVLITALPHRKDLSGEKCPWYKRKVK